MKIRETDSGVRCEVKPGVWVLISEPMLRVLAECLYIERYKDRHGDGTVVIDELLKIRRSLVAEEKVRQVIRETGK